MVAVFWGAVPFRLFPCSLFPSHPPPCAFFSAPMIFGYLTVFPPSPPPALAERSSRREGGVSKFILPGASPPAPLRPGGKRHWLFLWKAVPEGGLVPGVAGWLCCAGARGGGLSFASPAAPALSLLSCPHPPDPLPGGKGETLGYFMQGASPLASPALKPGGTGFSFGRRCPRGGFAPCIPGQG